MARTNLTDRAIYALKPAEREYHVWDGLVPGLGVRVSPNGVRSFVLYVTWPRTRKPARRSLGKHGVLLIDDAREKARGWLKLVLQGIDPQAELERLRLEAEVAAQRAKDNSFGAVAEAFFAFGRREKHSRASTVEREVKREFVAIWKDRAIHEIRKDDVVAVIDAALNRGKPYQAHALFGYAKRIFNWAMARGVYGLESSPCDRIQARDLIGKRAMRSRVLSNDELFVLWRVARRMPFPWGPMLQLLILTGQRRTEVSASSWPEYELDKAMWTIPAERFKQRSMNLVPLSGAAVTVLEKVPRFRKGAFVFTATLGKSPVNGFVKFKKRLDDEMLQGLKALARARGDDPSLVKLEPFVLHDVRRTLRTRLSELRVPDAVAEMAIGHGKTGVERIYNQHRYIDEMREAFELWSKYLDGLRVLPAKNVVPMRKPKSRRAVNG